MNSNKSRSQSQLEDSRNQNQQIEITQFMSRNNQIKHRGYIDKTKLEENTRILSFNLNSINPQDNMKITMLLQAIKSYQIVIAMLNEINIKWSPQNLDKIEKELKKEQRSKSNWA